LWGLWGTIFEVSLWWQQDDGLDSFAGLDCGLLGAQGRRGWQAEWAEAGEDREGITAVGTRVEAFVATGV